MKINFFTEEVKFPFKKIGVRNILRSQIKNIIESENKQLDNLNFIFCTNDYLIEINKQYLKHDYYTDVITFDYSENLKISGDIFISLDMVNENSIKYNTTFEHELYRVIFHGILHLCGYRDETKEEILLMREKEDFYLNYNNILDAKLYKRIIK